MADGRWWVALYVRWEDGEWLRIAANPYPTYTGAHRIFERYAGMAIVNPYHEHQLRHTMTNNNAHDLELERQLIDSDNEQAELDRQERLRRLDEEAADEH